MPGMEIKRALRSLRQDVRFSAVAVLTLGLGVGACAAIFSVINVVLLRPLPYPDPEQLVAVLQVNEGGGLANFSDPNYEDFRDRNRTFETLVQYSLWTYSVAGGSTPDRARVATVSRGFFETLGVRPLLGRSFLSEEQQPGGTAVAVVSFGLFQRLLGGAEDLSSHQLRISGIPHQVVGVMPPGFDFPPGADLWRARELQPRYESRTAHNWRVVGRLREEVSLEQAKTDLSAIARQLHEEHGDDNWIRDAALSTIHDAQVSGARTALWVLMAAVTFLLLVACANVANLMLARLLSRRRELGVRHALGAGRLALARELLAEVVLLAVLGAGVGVLLARLGVDVLLRLEPGNLPRATDIEVDTAVLVFALAVSMMSAIGLGLVAILRATGAPLGDALGDGQRGVSGGPGGTRLRGSLVVAQLAITLVLLLGAGLLARSLWKLLAVDPGFETASRLVLELRHPDPNDDEEKRRLGALQLELLERLEQIPGVQAVGAIDALPIATGSRNGLFLVMQPGEELPDFETFGELMKEPGRTGSAEYRSAAPGYFETLGIPLVAGRMLERRDPPNAAHVALVSRSLAERQWPGESPVGKLLEFGNMDGDLRVLEVVGVVADVRMLGLHLPPPATIYTHAHQRPPSRFSVVIETDGGDPAALVPQVRQIVGELDPELPPRFRTLDEVVGASVAGRRFLLSLLVVFGGTALSLAAIGIYGVAAFFVSQRTQEIGLRIAVGAQAGDILRLVLREGLGWVGAGVALGLLGAFGVSRLLTSLLYEIGATDVPTYLAVAAVIAVVGLLSCTLPARGAIRIDPIVALREE